MMLPTNVLTVVFIDENAENNFDKVNFQMKR